MLNRAIRGRPSPITTSTLPVPFQYLSTPLHAITLPVHVLEPSCSGPRFACLGKTRLSVVKGTTASCTRRFETGGTRCHQVPPTCFSTSTVLLFSSRACGYPIYKWPSCQGSQRRNSKQHLVVSSVLHALPFPHINENQATNPHCICQLHFWQILIRTLCSDVALNAQYLSSLSTWLYSKFSVQLTLRLLQGGICWHEPV
jgi:hypothetical protein